MRVLRVACLATAVLASAAGAQGPARSCAELLSAPTADSTTAEVEVVVRPFESGHSFSVSYAHLFGEGIRQYFRPAAPLTLDTYTGRRDDRSPKQVHLTIS